MKLLFMTLLCVIESTWIQQGKWHSTQATNNSFIYDLLKANEGYAEVKGDSYVSKYGPIILTITLESYVEIQVTMKSHKYIDTPIYHLETADFRVNYFKNSAKYYKSLNFTLVHRTKLEFNSTVGDFVIDLIDNEALFPNRLNQLTITAFLLAAQGITVFLKYLSQRRKKQLNTILTCFSLQVLLMWIVKILIQIYWQSLLLSQNSRSLLLKLLTITAFLAYLSAFVLSTIIVFNRNGQLNCMVGVIRFTVLFVFLLLALLMVPEQLPLLFTSTLTNLCQAIIFAKMVPTTNHLKRKVEKLDLLLHFGFYFFPMAVFPYFVESINYPRMESQLWWAYIFLYVFEVTFFFLNLNGGLFAVVRRLRYYLKKKRRAYCKIEEEICALCFREINNHNASAGAQIAPIEVSKVIHHFCNRYFHEACIKQRYIEKCFFDNMAWSKQSVVKDSL